MPDRTLKIEALVAENAELRRRLGALEAIAGGAELERERLFDLSVDMLVVAGLDGIFRQVNPAWTRALGWSAEELCSRPWLHFVHPEDVQTSEAAKCELRDGLAIYSFENRYRHKDGGYRWLSWDSFPVPEAGLVYAVARDVTNRKRLDAELERARAEWHQVFDAFGHPTVILDPDRTIREANRAALLAAGLEPARMIGRKCYDVLHRGEPAEPPCGCPFETMLESRTVQTFEMQVEAFGRWCLVSCTPVLDAEGRLEKVIHIATDVTERRAAEDRLRQAQKMEAIGRLAGGIAHDFNNLLTGILAYAQDIQAGTRPGEDVHESASIIETSALRAAELTRGLLGFARKGPLARTPVEVSMLLTEVAAVLRRTVDRRIEVVELPSTEAAVLLGDVSQLQQVVLNLAVNARDAMPEGGRLTLATRVLRLDGLPTDGGLPAGEYVELSVADDGEGIAPEDVGHIFDPFFTTKPEGKGTGLGLATVYGIVTAHGGSVTVESEPGRGSTFRVLLPRAAAAPRRPIGLPGDLVCGHGRILVVDDEEVIRNLAKRILERAGYEVVTAVDGLDGLETFRARQGEIDLVIVDLVMPRMNGRDCLGRILELAPEARILVSSGYGPDETVRGLLEAGALGAVAKPYVLRDLTEAVAAALSR